MASPNKTAGIIVLAQQEVLNGNTVKSPVQDVATKFAATLFLWHGFRAATANTNPQRFIIEVSSQESGDNDWAALQTITTKTGTPADEDLDAAEAAGDTVLEVTLTAGFAEGDLVLVDDNSDATQSEWRTVKSVVLDTSVTITQGLEFAKGIGDDLFGNAEVFVVQLDLLAIKRIRVTYMNEGATAPATVVKVEMITADTIA